MHLPRPQNNEPYGFSISYQSSVDNAYTMLTGFKRVVKRDAKGDPIPGQYDEVEIPNSSPMLTQEGGKKLRLILEQNMDKFNPIGNLTEQDCAKAAADVERALAATITLQAAKYLYNYWTDPAGKELEWDAYVKNLTGSMFRFATLAKKGHFIEFAKGIMSESHEVNGNLSDGQGMRGALARAFSRPRKGEQPDSY